MQRTLLFTLPAAWTASHRLDAADWRSLWIGNGIGTFADWNGIRVVPVRELLWVISGSPAANDWLARHLDGIAATVAEEVADAVPLAVRDRPVAVRGGDETLWAYRFPRLIVEKGGGDWARHFELPLSPDLADRMLRRMEASLRRELAVWSRLPDVLVDAPFLALFQPGRPLVIRAIHSDRSGHGKPVNALARADVAVLSTVRIEGDLFAGPLASLGYGRMRRTAPPEVLDRSLQRALSALPVLTEESE